jgi:phosphate transport system substrate-binding protein
VNKRGAFRTAPWALLAVAALAGCRFQQPDPAKDDTTTWGRVLVLADVDCRAVVEQERTIFSAIYPDAHLDIRYMDEATLLKAMLNDSVRCAISSVLPGGEQQAYFNKRQLSAPVVPIYKSGIAVVVNPSSALQRLDLAQVARLLGKTDAVEVSTDAEKKLDMDTLTALFAGAGSGVARLMRDALHIGTLRAKALPDLQAVVAQVARDPRSIGFLPFEAISDLDDPAQRALREQVRILPIAQRAADTPVLPSQSSLADGSYPLERTVNMVLTEGKSGLGTGFVSFVANHKGQRIILKLGVAPITVPTRDIQVVHQ